MTAAEPRSPVRALASLLRQGWTRFRPPVGTVRFWIAQFGVLSIALGDEVILDGLRRQLPFGVPNSATTSLPHGTVVRVRLPLSAPPAAAYPGNSWPAAPGEATPADAAG